MEKIQGLLCWSQNMTKGYPGVNIKDFNFSWKNGLAFAALIHKFKPELIDFHRLNPENEYYNNATAFKMAEAHFRIPSLLDPKDMALMHCPEQLSIITYVSQYYNCLKDMEPNGGPDINRFENYDDKSSDFETISSRQSIYKLTKMKCSICHCKVFLLERYVAEDKLYHRQCYRDFQLENLNNDSKVIEDYLNIYGVLKPTMKPNIYVHPLKGHKSNSQIVSLITHPPVSVTECISSSIDDSDLENNSENNLSSFSSKDSDKFYTIQSELTKDADFSEITNDASNDATMEDLHINSQDNLVFNINKTTQLRPIKPRLYIKKKDKELPYATCFKVVDNTTYMNCVNFDKEENERLCEKTNKINLEENNNTDYRLTNNERKEIKIKIEDEIESDLSNMEEDCEETKQTISRNSIWRKPIISSTYNKTFNSILVPIDTKYKRYSEFENQLLDLNKKQFDLESKGRAIQLKLWIEDQSSPEYEGLLNAWLELVDEKDKIFYEENSLYSWLEDLKLKEIKERIEYQIRLLYTDNNYNEYVMDIENDLIKKLIKTVNKRSELADLMHEEHLKRLETMKMTQDALKSSCSCKEKEEKLIEPKKRQKAPKKKISFRNKRIL